MVNTSFEEGSVNALSFGSNGNDFAGALDIYNKNKVLVSHNIMGDNGYYRTKLTMHSESGELDWEADVPLGSNTKIWDIEQIADDSFLLWYQA